MTLRTEAQNLEAMAKGAKETSRDWHTADDMRNIFSWADADFIAAASPVAVLTLINERRVALLQLDIQMDLAAKRGEERDQLKAENEALRSQVDRLLDHCPDGECGTCGEIICPHGGAMHFHHDGCPSCAEHDAAEWGQMP